MKAENMNDGEECNIDRCSPTQSAVQ